MYSLIFPYKYRNKHCEQILNWSLNYYNINFLNKEIIIGEDDSELFSRANAINNGANKAKYDIFIIIDIDIIVDFSVIQQAHNLLTQYSYVIPYNNIYKLNKESTNRIIHSNNYNKPENFTIEKEHSHNNPIYAGGIQCVTKQIFNNVNGYDSRFIGWGGEDYAFCKRIKKKYKKGIYLKNTILHLWHEEQPTKKDYLNNSNNFNRQLYDKEYRVKRSK